MKLRIVLKTKTKKGNDVELKLKVPPSKVQGLANFINIASDNDEDVSLLIEKNVKDKREISKLRAKFKFYEE